MLLDPLECGHVELRSICRELPKNEKLILGERRDRSRSKFTAEVESSKSRGGENFANVLLEYAMRALYQW